MQETDSLTAEVLLVKKKIPDIERLVVHLKNKNNKNKKINI